MLQLTQLTLRRMRQPTKLLAVRLAVCLTLKIILRIPVTKRTGTGTQISSTGRATYQLSRTTRRTVVRTSLLGLEALRRLSTSGLRVRAACSRDAKRLLLPSTAMTILIYETQRSIPTTHSKDTWLTTVTGQPGCVGVSLLSPRHHRRPEAPLTLPQTRLAA